MDMSNSFMLVLHISSDVTDAIFAGSAFHINKLRGQRVQPNGMPPPAARVCDAYLRLPSVYRV